MKSLLLAFLLVFTVSTIHSQAVFKTYSGERNNDYLGTSVIKTSDNNFLITSTVIEANSIRNAIFLSKVNSQGDTIWQSEIYTNDTVNFIIKRTFENGDGSFMVFSQTIAIENFNCFGSSYTGASYLMTKFGADGQFQWHKTIPSNCSRRFGDVAQLSSGNFLVGSRYGDFAQSSDIEIIIVDTSAALVLQNINTLPATLAFVPRQLLKKNNNTYYLLTSTSLGLQMIEVDLTTGGIYTNTPILNSLLNSGSLAIELNYGNFLVLSGGHLPPEPYFKLMKINNLGSIIWETPVDFDYTSAHFIAEDIHGRAYIGYNNQNDFHALIFDKHGVFIYEKKITRPGEREYPHAMTFDNLTNELVVVGGHQLPNDSLSKTFFMKDTVQLIVSNYNYDYSNNVKVFPNPSNGIIQLESKNASFPLNISIYDVLGKLVYEEKITNSINTINLKHLKDGVYLYQIVDDSEKISTGKILIQNN